MAAQILDGKATAAAIRQEIADEVQQWVAAGGAVPCLTAVLVGDDPASHVYVRNKHRACQQASIDGRIVQLPIDATEQELLAVIDSLNHKWYLRQCPRERVPDVTQFLFDHYQAHRASDQQDLGAYYRSIGAAKIIELLKAEFPELMEKAAAAPYLEHGSVPAIS